MFKGSRFCVLGRVGMDLYPEARSKISHAELLKPALGGSSGNIAAGLARLNQEVDILSLVSDDPVGEFVKEQCAHYGIGASYLYTAPAGTNTNLALAENRLDDFEVVIYRNNAADLALNIEHIDQVDFDKVDVLVLTGTALSAEPSRSAAMEAMRRAKYAVLDLDYRKAAWVNEVPKDVFTAAMALCDMVVGNDEEFDLVGGIEAARAYGQEKVAIYKMGALGAKSFVKGDSFETPIFEVDALKPVGAGDAFLSGMLAALADEKPIERAVQEGAANAAIVVSRPACSSAMATRSELNEFISRRL